MKTFKNSLTFSSKYDHCWLTADMEVYISKIKT